MLFANANPIGKIVYYALRIEFQIRGSPHLHAPVWTSDYPKLTSNTKQDYIDLVFTCICLCVTCTLRHCIPLAYPLTDSNDGVLWAPVIYRKANHGPRTYIGLTG